MPNNNNVPTGITSPIDGIVPVYDPSSRWTIWNLDELYLGTTGHDRYVGRVNDYVVNIPTDEWFKIISVDPSTLVPELEQIRKIPVSELEPNTLFGVGPGQPSDTYRVYIDKSVQPYTMAVDARLHVAGTMVTKCKLFKGSELNGTAVIVSGYYDQTGLLLTQEVPLELVALPNNQNVSIKTVAVCYTSYDIADGEIITAVFYSDTGGVVSKRQLLAENTAFIRSAAAGVKYVSSIGLKSPFLSKTDPDLIQYPLNVPLNGLNLIGIVNYSDGSTIELPVDNTKFSMFGFEGYVATIIGQKFPIVLRYNLSPDEVAYGIGATNDKFITDTYHVTTIKANGSFVVKLYCYPVWVDAANGYNLKWFMQNLERTNIYDVSHIVRINANSRAFDPTAYGVLQHLSVSLNLKDVNGVFSNYNYVQTVDVSLMAPGTDRTTNWTIAYDPNQTTPYGRGIYADTTFINQTVCKIRLMCSKPNATFDEWLQELYLNAKPLTDSNMELAPPTPNFFSIINGPSEIEFPISYWDTEQLVGAYFPNSSTVFVKFTKRTPDNSIQLAIVGLPVYQNN